MPKQPKDEPLVDTEVWPEHEGVEVTETDIDPPRGE